MKSNRFQLILRFWFWNGYPSTQYSSIQRRESCLTRNMARFYYECNTDLKNYTEDSETIKPYACTSDKYCLYCCCNSQCCLLVQKRPPRHFWEAWYFWLGIALLAVFIVSLVSSYIVSNCRHNIQGVPLRHSAHGNRRNDRGGHSTNNQNEISISIIPTSEFFPSHRKMFVITSQPAVNHLTPVVAWSRSILTERLCRREGAKSWYIILWRFTLRYFLKDHRASSHRWFDHRLEHHGRYIAGNIYDKCVFFTWPQDAITR